MDKSPDAFRSIGEVSRLVGVAPHVLRYWETQFTQLSPVKRGDGRRYYRPDDVRLVAGLCQVMREEGLSIRGAKRLIAVDRGAGLRQIGARRLGEPAPVVATAIVAEAPAKKAVAPARPSPTAAPARRRTSPDYSLPLFPDMDRPTAPWLTRLTRLAAALRDAESDPSALPAQAEALRDRLVAAR